MISELFFFFLSLSELREDNCPPPPYLVDGVKALISALRTWLKRVVSGLERSPACPVPHLSLTCLSLPFQVSEPSSEVPDNIRPNHLIKELTKEIRYLEVREESHKSERFQAEAVTLG